MERMKNAINPLFTDMTWGAGGSTAELTMDLCKHSREAGHTSNMHLTCTNMEKDGDPKKAVHDALQQAFDSGIRNIVALRGDPPAGQDEWKAAEGGFTCALDLVQYIRENFGDSFGISVAGYPEGHPNAISEIEDPSTMTASEKARSSTFDGKTYTCKDDDYKKEMDYLKKKVDAGSDLIITQMFFDTKVFGQFVKDCKEWGINCPVVPGIICINAYAGFCKMTKFCKTRVPAELQAKMDSMKDDADALKAFGVSYGVQMCQELIEIGVEDLHFYTLNLEKVVYGILTGLGYEVKAEADEADAASMVAKGSAWARVGDSVKSAKGNGVVKVINTDGSAVVTIDGSDVTLAKGEFEKEFS
mmetsp:Transcript_8180/g.23506  ORF Transcript_8180/g.23506 Transcript_8180/m.23506 type:complete len:359 (-) Transcript_8180:164-1240(-)